MLRLSDLSPDFQASVRRQIAAAAASGDYSTLQRSDFVPPAGLLLADHQAHEAAKGALACARRELEGARQDLQPLADQHQAAVGHAQRLDEQIAEVELELRRLRAAEAAQVRTGIAPNLVKTETAELARFEARAAEAARLKGAYQTEAKRLASMKLPLEERALRRERALELAELEERKARGRMIAHQVLDTARPALRRLRDEVGEMADGYLVELLIRELELAPRR